MLDKNLSKTLTIAVIILSIFLAVQAYNGIQQSRYIGQDQDYPNTINVSATGEAFSKPDVAQVSVSVKKEASTVISAQSEHSKAMNDVVDYLKDNRGIIFDPDVVDSFIDGYRTGTMPKI